MCIVKRLINLRIVDIFKIFFYDETALTFGGITSLYRTSLLLNNIQKNSFFPQDISPLTLVLFSYLVLKGYVSDTRGVHILHLTCNTVDYYIICLKFNEKTVITVQQIPTP